MCLGSGGALVRGLVSHHCVLVHVTLVKFVVRSHSCFKGFSCSSPVFLPSGIRTFPRSSLPRKIMDEEPFCGWTTVLFIYCSIYIGRLASLMFGAIVSPSCVIVIHFWFSKLICERLMLQSCSHGGNGSKYRYNLRREGLSSWYHPLHVNQITYYKVFAGII